MLLFLRGVENDEENVEGCGDDEELTDREFNVEVIVSSSEERESRRKSANLISQRVNEKIIRGGIKRECLYTS